MFPDSLKVLSNSMMSLHPFMSQAAMALWLVKFLAVEYMI